LKAWSVFVGRKASSRSPRKERLVHLQTRW
jgi:hypothetical protein